MIVQTANAGWWFGGRCTRRGAGEWRSHELTVVIVVVVSHVHGRSLGGEEWEGGRFVGTLTKYMHLDMILCRHLFEECSIRKELLKLHIKMRW